MEVIGFDTISLYVPAWPGGSVAWRGMPAESTVAGDSAEERSGVVTGVV